MSPSRTACGGLGFLPALAIAFIVLRLCEVIAWSWWIVLAPLWAPFALMFVLLLAIGLALAVAACFTLPRKRMKK